MIVSASRRTDIPAHYADWFFHRLQEGFVCTRNPMNHRQVSRIDLSPEAVDGYVFWTKNPIPMVNRLPLLGDTPYYFQFSLTAYGRDLEPGLPSKNDVLVPAFQTLARQLGPERMVWRYDPIILTPVYTAEYHLHYFRQLARRLTGCTDTCVISFFDHYAHLRKAVRDLRMESPSRQAVAELAAGMAQTALEFGFRLTTCSEVADLDEFGIEHGRCIDPERLSRIAGYPIRAARDTNQRQACGCAISVDIGMYNCCQNGCRYCYANHAENLVQENCRNHNPHAPLLYGAIQPEDWITERKMTSFQSIQICLDME